MCSQRISGYARKENDNYATPSWVTRALVPHIPDRIQYIYEPAAGSGKMVRVLGAAGYQVGADDISEGRDFLQCIAKQQAIISNPPYSLATEFIVKAISLTYPRGFVAMLLRTDFDHAKTRADLFAHSAIFSKKLVLTKRIKWFENSTGSPSFNHAWYLWDWLNKGPPTIAYDIQN